MAFRITNLISWLQDYAIVQRSELQGLRDNLENANVALRLCQDLFKSTNVKYEAAISTISDCRNQRAVAENAKFVAEQQAEQARAQLKLSDQWATALEKAREKTEADAKDARAETEAANARIEAMQHENNELADALTRASDDCNVLVKQAKATCKDSLQVEPPTIPAPARMPAQWCKEQVARHLTAFQPSDILNIAWADSYPVFGPDALKPLLAYWKQYIMPPNDDPAELFVCRKRALSLAAFIDKQVGRPLFCFSGTHPYALGPDGQPGAHIFNGALDTTGALWLVDPAWLPDLIIPWPAGARASQMLGF